MDLYVPIICRRLGLHKLIESGFPTTEQMIFIELIVKQNNLDEALKNNAEATQKFEKEGLKNLVSVTDFFDQLLTEIERGSYRSATIRMDMQVSTRVIDHTPDCKLNMDLKTASWNAKLNMSMATCEKLLLELQNAKTAIRQDHADALKEQEG